MSDLPKTMKAIVAHAPRDYRLEEVPVPRAGEGEIVIKVEACGVCAGDVKAEHGASRFWEAMALLPISKDPLSRDMSSWGKS